MNLYQREYWILSFAYKAGRWTLTSIRQNIDKPKRVVKVTSPDDLQIEMRQKRTTSVTQYCPTDLYGHGECNLNIAPSLERPDVASKTEWYESNSIGQNCMAVEDF